MRSPHGPPLWAAVLLVSACIGQAADHETIADRAYAEGRYGDALVEYRLALSSRAPNATLRAKAAAAALHVGDLEAAAHEYVALAREGGESRAGEAADGLVRVANVAIEAGNQTALAQVLDGLQAVAPGRALGDFARQLAASLGSVSGSLEALTVLTFAAAGAPDARTQDSLMYAYGTTLRRLGRCQDATPVFESLLRRQRDRQVAEQSRDGLVRCALQLGRRAVDAGQPRAAERWFELAATRGGESPATRAAYIGLGDVRFALGDPIGAIEAYEQARAGLAPGDSLYAMVSERLNRLGRPDGAFR